VLQPKIVKNTKISSFGVQGRSRSSMLTYPKSPSPVLVMICSKSIPICYSATVFTLYRANSNLANTQTDRQTNKLELAVRDRRPSPSILIRQVVRRK